VLAGRVFALWMAAREVRRLWMAEPGLSWLRAFLGRGRPGQFRLPQRGQQEAAF